MWTMTIPTILFGLLPTYNTIGITSTILVFINRFIQGLSMGDATAFVYIVEESPSHLKGFLIGLVYAMICGNNCICNI